jgi:molybdopterin-guanine dinucleotide biosynthesis protein A
MLTVVIQAGGQSRRMGSDKALIPFLGRPLIERVLGRLRGLATEVIITTNAPQNYQYLGLPLVTDLIPNRGALGGLYTALSVAQASLVAVIACDMPFVNPRLLAYQRDLLGDSQWDAAIPRTKEGAEPFHAIYRKSTCLPAVENAIQSDKWRVDTWFGLVNIRFLTPQELAQYDPQRRAFWNVNTPEELQEAEQVVSEAESSPNDWE